MPSADPMTVSLTPELRRFIEAQVASGRYQTASEVVRAGLRLLTMADLPHQPGQATADTTIFPKKT
jgi:antitoxin ParD1/3/4